jgi:hypothetical protein
MERYWNGDFWTGDYRPAEELQGQFGIAPNEPDPAPVTEDAPTDVWSALDKAKPTTQDEEPLFAPGVRTEYSVGAPKAPVGSPPYGYPQQQAYGQYPVQVNPNQSLGILAVILAFFVPLAGAIVGHVAYSKAVKTRTSKSLPLTAIIVGWVFFAFSLLFWLPFTVALFGGLNSSSDYDSDTRDFGGESSYSQSSDDVIPDYSLSQEVNDKLDETYPDYDTWYGFCDTDLPLETGATTECRVVVYPFAETNESEEFTATVKYLSGDSFTPEVEVTLDKEPTPLESFPRN